MKSEPTLGLCSQCGHHQLFEKIQIRHGSAFHPQHCHLWPVVGELGRILRWLPDPPLALLNERGKVILETTIAPLLDYGEHRLRRELALFD